MLPEYVVEKKEMVDESVAVLYNTISELIEDKKFWIGKIIGRWLSIAAAARNSAEIIWRIACCRCWSWKLSRASASNTSWTPEAFVRNRFEETYRQAEDILQTRYKEWENRSRSEYFRVRNNYFFLFTLAYRIKQEFFNENGFIRIKLAVEGNDIKRGRNWEIYRREDKDENTITIPLDKLRLSLKSGEELTYIKTLPDIFFKPVEIVPIIKPDIYNVVRVAWSVVRERRAGRL